jgi:hypothetical protein
MGDGRRIFNQAVVSEAVAEEAWIRLAALEVLFLRMEIGQRPPTRDEAAGACAAIKNAMAVIRSQYP